MQYLEDPNIGALRKFVKQSPGIAAFIGAGCSAALSIPQWKKMLIRLNEEFKCYPTEEHVIQDIEISGYAAVATNIKNMASDETLYKSLLRKHLSPVSCHFTSLHIELIRLSKLILTTNYDQSFEETLKALERLDTNLDFKYHSSTLGNFNSTGWGFYRHIFHIHGDTLSGEVVLTTESYEEQYNDPSTGMAILVKTIFAGYPTIFVGFSFEDSFFVNFLKRSLTQIKAEKARFNVPFPKHYCIISDNHKKEFFTAEELLKNGVDINDLIQKSIITEISSSTGKKTFIFSSHALDKLNDGSLSPDIQQYLVGELKKIEINREKLQLLKDMDLGIIYYEGSNYLQIEYILRELNANPIASAASFKP